MEISILVVEDEPLIQKLYADYLKKEGYHVLLASNGRKGLDLAISSKPDLILLDFLMPVMNGMEMLKALRKDLWGKTAKVIILTNLSREENEMMAAEHMVFDYLVKADLKLSQIGERIKLVLKL